MHWAQAVPEVFGDDFWSVWNENVWRTFFDGKLSCRFSPGKIGLGFVTKTSPNIHTEVDNKQRDNSPSARSEGNLA